MFPFPVRLVTRGDDAGCALSANRAILDAHQNGILKNVSIMAPAPEFDDAAALLRDVPDLCLGLHVTLTAEWDFPRWGPVLPREKVPSLLDEEGFFPRATGWFYETGFELSEMMAEIEAQLAKMRAAGLQISYLDEHMGVGWLPGLRQELIGFCNRENLIYASMNGLPPAPQKGANPIEDVISRLENAPPGDYVLVGHPCFAEAEDVAQFHGSGVAKGDLGKQRDWERRIFTDARVREACEKTGMQVVRYDEVLKI